MVLIMNITKKLCYGTDENIPEELLYVKRIILRNYKAPQRVKTFLEILSNFKIFQYNYDKAIDSDYFLWQNVEKDEKDWTHVDLCCYQNSIEGVYKMWSLYKICEDTYTDINCEVQFEDIRKLVNEIEEERNE